MRRLQQFQPTIPTSNPTVIPTMIPTDTANKKRKHPEYNHTTSHKSSLSISTSSITNIQNPVHKVTMQA
jgi:hypothetical protein